MQKNYKKVKLSSKWTTFGYYFVIAALIIALLGGVFLINVLISDFQINFLLALVMLLVLLVFCYYVIKFLAVAHIEDNIIYLKKFSQVEKRYALEELNKIKVYENRRDKYIIVTMKKGQQSEKFLMVNSKAFYSGEIRNTESVLTEILEYNNSQLS